MQRTNRPQRHSVASFPYIVTQENSEVINRPSFLELLNPRRENVACTGQTAKLHERTGGNKSPESSRKISLSYKPYLTVAPPQTPYRRYSTSSISSRLFYSRNEKSLQDDNKNTSSTQSLTDDNNNSLNSNGSAIPQDTNKLPKIVLTAPDLNPEKNKKKRKKKRVENDLKAVEVDLNEDNGGETNLNKEDVIPEVPAVPSSRNSNDNNEEDDDGKDWKYKLEAQYFQLGWDTTKPFTYSYFPKLKKEPKNNKEKKTKKTEKKVASATHRHDKTS